MDLVILSDSKEGGGFHIDGQEAIFFLVLADQVDVLTIRSGKGSMGS